MPPKTQNSTPRAKPPALDRSLPAINDHGPTAEHTTNSAGNITAKDSAYVQVGNNKFKFYIQMLSYRSDQYSAAELEKLVQLLCQLASSPEDWEDIERSLDLKSNTSHDIQSSQIRSKSSRKAHRTSTGGEENSQTATHSNLLDRLQNTIIKAKEREQDEFILRWLGPPQSPDLYEVSIRMKINNTGDWILSNSKFLQWASTDFTSGNAKALWIHGLSGFGKTVLCARIIEHLKASFITPVGYFFLSSRYDNLRDPFTAMHDWLLQILPDGSVFKAIRRIWQSRSKETISQRIIIELFKMVVEQVPGCTFVLDGLDECGSAQTTYWQTSDELIKTFLTELCNGIKQTKTRILLVSQDDWTIRENIHSKGIVLFEHRITPEDVHDDILLYAQSIVEDKIPKATRETKIKLVKQMDERCNGQFQWLKSLQRPLSRKPMVRELEEAIAEAPPGLDELYERNWKKVSALMPQNLALAIDTLRWVAFSFRPLKVLELANALMVDLSQPSLLTRKIPDEIDEDFVLHLEDICAGLIETRASNVGDEAAKWTVHLSHQSVKEFLLQATISTEGTKLQTTTEISSNTNKESAKLASLCLHYLNFKSTWENYCAKSKTESLPPTQAFRAYASTYWHQHLIGLEKNNEELVKLINRFFALENSAWDAWESWSSASGPDERVLKREHKTPNGNRLHYACQLNLLATASHVLLQQPSLLDARTPSGATSLWIACAEGHTSIVKMLVAANANLIAERKDGYTALDMASMRGSIQVVKALLAAKVAMPPNGKCLCLAADGNHYETVVLLLNYGVDVSAKNHDSNTALHIAATEGYLEVLRLLLDRGAPVSAVDNDGLTPLHGASLKGHADTTELLLLNGADANSMDNSKYVPLHFASKHGYSDVISLLIKYGARINHQDKHGKTPLRHAVQRNEADTVKILLENNARSDILAYKDNTAPIHIAAGRAYHEVLRLLLQHTADPEIRSTSKLTPLLVASANSNYAIMQMLLEYGADPLKTARDGATSLHYIAECRSTNNARWFDGYSVVQDASHAHRPAPASWEQLYNPLLDRLFNSGGETTGRERDVALWNDVSIMMSSLLQFDTGISARDGDGMIIRCNKLGIAKLLIKYGADVTAVDDKGWTPLHRAAERQDIGMMGVLIEHGADIDAINEYGWTPLYTCAAAGNVSDEAMNFFIQHNADICIADNNGWGPVQVAIENCDIRTVTLLIKAGADVSSVTAEGTSSILLASPAGTAEVLQLLLDEGANASQHDNEGITPLMVASRCGNLEAVQWLLAAAPGVTGELDGLQRSAFFYAAARGHVGIAELLFAANSDVLVTKDITGTTALGRAAREGHNAVVRSIATMASAAQISLSIPELEWEDMEPVPFDFNKSYCDICIQDISLESTYYQCPLCKNGNFSICDECHRDDETCLVPTHHLERMEPESNSDTESQDSSDSEQA